MKKLLLFTLFFMHSNFCMQTKKQIKLVFTQEDFAALSHMPQAELLSACKDLMQNYNILYGEATTLVDLAERSKKLLQQTIAENARLKTLVSLSADKENQH